MKSDDNLLPVRRINTFVFCPRLCWLEQVEGVFLDNHHTLEGSHVHRRVDKPGGTVKPPNGNSSNKTAANDTSSEATAEEQPWHSRSLWLAHEELGVSGKLDLVEDTGEGVVMPVDTKKGKPTPEGQLWPADRVQLTLQAMLLEAQGYNVTQIAAWYHSARKRVVEDLSDEMRQQAREAIAQTQACITHQSPPPPLEDAPQCKGCSLQPICLPDELNALRAQQTNTEGEKEKNDTTPSTRSGSIRRIIPVRDDALALYVQEAGARIGLSQGCLKITPRKGSDNPSTPQKVGLMQLSQINLMGGVQMTTQALQACLRAERPVNFFSTGGWYYGRATGTNNRQVHVRIAQFAAFPGPKALGVARQLVADKIANCRVMLRRNATELDNTEQEILQLKRLVQKASQAESPETLLGLEGDAARRYWSVFSDLLARDHETFRMLGRNRRPPRDPSNAMLSYGYSLLVKDCTIAVTNAGLDPFLGMYHTPHHGRPSMALDLMEPFRPLIVDSMVLLMIRRSEVQPDDFIITGQAVALKPRARKALIRAYERRMDELITHPVFGYRISYRQVLSIQARLLARMLLGELDAMPAFRTR